MRATTMDDAAVWVEVDGIHELDAIGGCSGPLVTTVPSWGASSKSRLDAPSNPHTCRCWRCSGATISLAERGALDRILARHLLRLSEVEREDWLMQWRLVPSHSPQDVLALYDWMEIERGASTSEPTYLPRRAW